MDISRLIHHDPPTGGNSNKDKSNKPAATQPPSAATTFHNFGPGDTGVKDLGIGVSAPSQFTPPTPKPPKAKVEPEPPRQGVSGKRKDKAPIDPSTIPDGSGDRKWEERRDKMGGPKAGIHAFRVKPNGKP